MVSANKSLAAPCAKPGFTWHMRSHSTPIVSCKKSCRAITGSVKTRLLSEDWLSISYANEMDTCCWQWDKRSNMATARVAMTGCRIDGLPSRQSIANLAYYSQYIINTKQRWGKVGGT